MKIKDIVQSRAVKVNLGDYQSTDFFTSMTAEVTPEDKGSVTILRRLVDRAMLANLSAHFKARGKPLSKEDICKRYGLTVEEISK